MKYKSPFSFFSSSDYNTELDPGISGHAALGLNLPLKGRHSLYSEIGFSHSFCSMEVSLFSADRISIPNFFTLKAGYRLAYTKRKKSRPAKAL
jgi:hypothetical protein